MLLIAGPTVTMARTTPRSADGSCRSFQFKCANHNCVSWYERCDGVNDCGDASDEYNCCKLLAIFVL